LGPSDRKRCRRPGSTQRRCITLRTPQFSRFALPVGRTRDLAGEPPQGQATSKRAGNDCESKSGSWSR